MSNPQQPPQFTPPPAPAHRSSALPGPTVRGPEPTGAPSADRGNRVQAPPRSSPPRLPRTAPRTSASTSSTSSSGTPYGFDDKGRVERTKISGVWIGLIAAAVVLILLIIFIAQNLDTVGLHFLGFYGKVSLGLAMLVAAICGLFIAAIPGTRPDHAVAQVAAPQRGHRAAHSAHRRP